MGTSTQYQSKTEEDLKKEAQKRGVTIPQDATKDQMVTALEQSDNEQHQSADSQSNRQQNTNR